MTSAGIDRRRSKKTLVFVRHKRLQAMGEIGTALASLQQLGLRRLGQVGELEQPAVDEDCFAHLKKIIKTHPQFFPG